MCREVHGKLAVRSELSLHAAERCNLADPVVAPVSGQRSLQANKQCTTSSLRKGICNHHAVVVRREAVEVADAPTRGPATWERWEDTRRD